MGDWAMAASAGSKISKRQNSSSRTAPVVVLTSWRKVSKLQRPSTYNTTGDDGQDLSDGRRGRKNQQCCPNGDSRSNAVWAQRLGHAQNSLRDHRDRDHFQAMDCP